MKDEDKSKNKYNVNELIEQNSSLRGQIANVVTEIDIHINDAQNPESLNIQNILDDLPIEQQIALYQDSIAELKMKLSHTQLGPIEKMEYEIKRKNEILYELKKSRKILRKVTSTHNKTINDLNQNYIKMKIEEMQNKIKEQKNEYRQLRLLYKKNEGLIKEQNNAIFILEDNCLFIKENIDYKKGTLINEKTQKNAQLFELEQNAQRIENIVRTQEDTYRAEVEKQKENITRITEEIETITLEINSILQQRRIQEIKMKQRKRKMKTKSNSISQIQKGEEDLSYNDNELNEMLKDESLPVISPKTKSSNEPSFIKSNNKYSEIQNTMHQLLNDIDKNSSLK